MLKREPKNPSAYKRCFACRRLVENEHVEWMDGLPFGPDCAARQRQGLTDGVGSSYDDYGNTTNPGDSDVR